MRVFVLAADTTFSPVRIEGRGRVISVFLSRGEGHHNFRCCECGKIVFQYTGEAELIFDGAAITEEKAIINVLCHRCQVIYRVM